jgi:hypothetical protein
MNAWMNGLLALPLVLGVTGCGPSSCPTELRIDFQPPFDEPGSYELRIQRPDADDVYLCEFELPAFESVCTGHGYSDVSINRSATDAGAQFTGLSFFSAPAQISVLVTREGEEVFSREFTPSYRVTEGGNGACLDGQIEADRD